MSELRIIDDEKVVQLLSEMSEVCRDADQGFLAAAERVKNNQLRALLVTYAETRRHFVLDLQAAIHGLGGPHMLEAKDAVRLKRGWNKNHLRGAQSEAEVLAECARAEEITRANYDVVLQMLLPTEVEALLKRHHVLVLHVADQLKTMRDLADERPPGRFDAPS